MKIIIYVLFVLVFNGCALFCKKSHKRHSVNFPKEMELAVFQKAKPTEDPNVRLDVCGTEIHFDQYGKRGDHGWEIDHIKPKSKGGGDKIKNLQPLHWETNRRKRDQWIKFKGIKPKDYCPHKNKIK